MRYRLDGGLVVEILRVNFKKLIFFRVGKEMGRR